jgi:hypothetical protein
VGWLSRQLENRNHVAYVRLFLVKYVVEGEDGADEIARYHP